MQNIRESKYVKQLDDGFKRYVKQKRSTKSPKEKMEARAGGFIDEDLVSLAKSFGCVFNHLF